ncbi:MAG: thiamine pyrophosphate-binding protein [Candidatus Acidoferrales bacterium]
MRADTALTSSVGLYHQFREQGYDFFVGVPCSGLSAFINDLQADKRSPFIPAPREDVALAMAAGAALGGKKPLVYLQSSGLGHLVNPIASLLKPYGLSVHLLISLRRKPFEHFFMHKITVPLLDLLEYDDYTIVEEPKCDD